MHLLRWKGLALLACLVTVWVPVAARAEPAALSNAERASVSLVAAFLDGGAESLWPRVAADSPLRVLGRERGTLELSVRLGSAQGSEWTLVHLAGHPGGRRAVFWVQFPSGIDDLLALDIDLASGELMRVSTLVETGGPGDSFLLGPLANLRLLLTRGDVMFGDSGSNEVETLLRAGAAPGAAGGQADFEAAARRLWLAQYRLLRADAQGALDVLGPETKSAPPMERLLRARVAAQLGDLTTAEIHYRELFKIWNTGAFRWELIELYLSAGDWTSAAQELAQLADDGSRDAEMYYAFSRMTLIQLPRASESAFRSAWRLQPIERSQLLEDPYFAYLLSQSDLSDLLRLEDPEEPVQGTPSSLRKPISWPARARFMLTGEHLSVAVGTALLSLPGGALLAPTEIEARPARELRRMVEARALAAVDGLRTKLRDPSLLNSPSLLRGLEQAASALSNSAEELPSGRREETWKRLVELTEVVQRAAKPPVQVTALRAAALWKLGRKQAAIDLLAKLASDPLLADETPTVVFQLARLCADEGRADLAVRLLRRLRNADQIPGLSRQIQRYELDDRLDSNYETYQTTGFELRYDRSLEVTEVVLLGGYLEAELQRLAEWIPMKSGPRIEVHLLPARDFYRVYGGGVGILGLFDGRIRLPVFEVGKQSAVMTGVLSHELAHAMIDRATRKCAPKWFHEGLAQLLEPGARQINPYRSGAKIITMPLVEHVLRGFSESSLVALAYQESFWTLRFVELQHGKVGIHRLIDAFSACSSTSESIAEALGRTPKDFDGELQAWARGPDAPLEDKGLRLAFTKEQLRHMETSAPGFEEAVEQRAGARRTLPKVGLTRDLPTEKDLEDRLVETVQKLMNDWHVGYSGRATPIKQTLSVVVRAYRGEAMPERRVEHVCQELSTLILSMHVNHAFESIDKDVNRTLRQAYAGFSEAAAACVRGRDIRPGLAKAEKLLGEAAYHLDKYGLKP